MKKGSLSLLLGLVFLLPAVVAAAILWHTLTQQIYANYEQRLSTGLNTLELVLQSSYQSLQASLSRIAADNTLMVTMDLAILPQLRRYLQAQFQVSGIDYLKLFDAHGRPLVEFHHADGGTQPDVTLCQASGEDAWEGLRKSADLLYMVRITPIIQKNRKLGHVCGALSLYAESYIDALQGTLGGLSAVWPGDEPPPAHLLQDIRLPHGADQDEMFDYNGVGGHYKGMVRLLYVGSEQLFGTILITLEALEKGFRNAVRSIAVVFALFTLIVLVGLHYQRQQRNAKAQLAEEQERALVTLSSIGDAVLTTNEEGIVTYMNRAAEKLIGARFHDLQGKTWVDYVHIKNEDSGLPVASPIAGSLHSGQKTDAPDGSVLVRPDGTEVAIQYSVTPIGMQHPDTRGTVVVLRDVHRERRLQRTLAWKASRDDLTGLLNRAEFRRRLEDAISRAKQRDIQHGLLLLDLDQFKVVNDSCGHHVGDQLLKNLATVLKAQLRSSDTLARLGGDEFGILLEACPPKRALEIAHQIRDDVGINRFSYAERVFDIGVSIGMTVINKNSGDVEGLMSQADAACYTAKELGRNRIQQADGNNERINYGFAEMQWASRIKEALRNDQFQLYIQPIVLVEGEGHGQDTAHGEILVRMLDDQGSLVAPGAFMPAAERYGLMPDIDRWIIRELFTRQHRQYQEAWKAYSLSSELKRCLYTINLSGASIIEPGFFEFVQQQMQAHSIPPELVCFEITETVAITHLSQATHFMRRLRAMGCRFLLDDFGSGMSSFGYLKNLPVDYLKIDGLFVKDIVDDPIDHAMVNAINEIGHVMGLKTVAEFVENNAILQELKVIGVDMAQGYGIAKPYPLP